jgi:hypothetical protein
VRGCLKCKKITKKEISPPCNLKHIINITPSDRNVYYTLSKLLPEAASHLKNLQYINTSQVVISSNTPSPVFNTATANGACTTKSVSPISSSSSKSTCSSVSSASSSSSSSSAYAHTTPASSLSESSSISTVSPPFIKINNNTFNMKVSGHHNRQNHGANVYSGCERTRTLEKKQPSSCRSTKGTSK